MDSVKPGPKPQDRAPVPVRQVTPDPLPFLSDVAAAEWRRIVSEAGHLSTMDAALLAAYCTAYERWLAAEALIRAHGMFTVTPNGYEVQSPAVSIAQKSMAMVHRLAKELGLSPIARSRIEGAQAEDPDADFFETR